MYKFCIKLFIMFLFSNLVLVFAQDIKKSELINPSLNAKENNYFDRQDEFLLNNITQTLNEFPPKYPIIQERTNALFILDAILHDKYAAFRKPVQEFYHNQIEKALREIENSDVKEGAKIWKLYNMGFIVKTKSTTLAFDLVRGSTAGSKEFELSNEIMMRFAKQCDVLFISHRHRDHIDKKTAQAFILLGKPVITNTQLWENDPIYEKITHLKREVNKKQNLPIKNGKIKLGVVIYPGHQMENTLNNVSLVFTPEGISISHLGDQINEGSFMVDYSWIDNVAKNYKVDILLPPCWTNELYRIVKGFNPKLVVPGHENELGHSVDDRVPFWGDTNYLELTNDELYNSDYPVIQMTWGESCQYIPRTKVKNPIEKLDELSEFSFSIISDNKGYSLENSHMYKCNKWISEAGDKFILGLGDHVKDNRTNKFLDLLREDHFWHNHFYPNVADGENEYWGKDQGDWGAGYPILEYVDMAKRKNVKLRDNKCEYYAIEEYKKIRVHIIQLHYSDTPKDPSKAFRENSREYLMNILDGIDKTNNDIVIVLAHTDSWFKQLNSIRKTKLFKKVDLILDANTHSFKHYNLYNGTVNTPLILNTGSIGNSIDNGFLQVHVLKNPTRMIIQYQRTNSPSRMLQEKGFAFEKNIGGKIKEIDWTQEIGFVH